MPTYNKSQLSEKILNFLTINKGQWYNLTEIYYNVINKVRSKDFIMMNTEDKNLLLENLNDLIRSNEVISKIIFPSENTSYYSTNPQKEDQSWDEDEPKTGKIPKVNVIYSKPPFETEDIDLTHFKPVDESKNMTIDEMLKKPGVAKALRENAREQVRASQINIICKYCNIIISTNEQYCPHCGKRVH